MIRRTFTKIAWIATPAALFLVIPGFTSAGETALSIFYVAGEDARYELRTYHPSQGTRTILELPGEPSNVYWTKEFRTITFRVGNEIFVADWGFGAKAKKGVAAPAGADDNYRETTVWYDIDSRAWRYHEIEYPADEAKDWKYFARVFQYDPDSGQWQELVERETHGCEQGDGSACGAEVHEYTKGRGRHVFLTDLAEGMRLGRLMDDRGVEYEESMEGTDLWFEFGDTEISVVPLFGDTLHAAPPVKWRDGDEPRTVFPADRTYSCMDQVGLKPVGKFLLVATEWYGRCGRVIDLETGATVHELPSNSNGAVIVPSPEGY